MMIGSFREEGEDYIGRLRTLCIDAQIAVIPAPPSDADNAPDWLVMLGDARSDDQIGAGWSRVGPRAGDYIALQIDDPVFPAPLRANLLRATLVDDAYPLLWSRAVAPGRADP